MLKQARQQAIQNLMFANATMHPAYSKLFFIAQNINDPGAKAQAFAAAAESINALWQVVENRLQEKRYLGGEDISAADVMLTVYSRWGQHFPVDIALGSRVKHMIDRVLKAPRLRRTKSEWLHAVADRPVPQEIGAAYAYQLVSIDLLGEQAMIKVECPLPGYKYVDFLGFLK